MKSKKARTYKGRKMSYRLSLSAFTKTSRERSIRHPESAHQEFFLQKYKSQICTYKVTQHTRPVAQNSQPNSGVCKLKFLFHRSECHAILCSGQICFRKFDKQYSVFGKSYKSSEQEYKVIPYYLKRKRLHLISLLE
jgi:hypothetical protein